MRQALGLAALALVLGGSPSGPPAARREQPVRFVVAGDTLAGSLSVPEGRGPFPAVILVSGGGQDDRDGRLGDFRHEERNVKAVQLALGPLLGTSANH